ncbi:MAG: hypothetical protein DRJ64_09005 [Thermoprotei archaeon]|nr:MAG: hypothetical protein DRJ64_09005 [Thermoprotei archaeon]
MNVIYEKLGYDKKDILLIIHADDVGMCHSVNEAALDLLLNEDISSCSLMVPCPWILEAFDFFKSHMDIDVGIHSTFTSEWRFYRWGPVTPKDRVRSLLDEQGYLWRNSLMVANNAKPYEIGLELESQISRALRFGIRPSHVDTHMGTVYTRPEFFMKYVDLSIRYGATPMVVYPKREVIEWAKRSEGVTINEEMINTMKDLKVPKLDMLFTKIEGHEYHDRLKGFIKILKSLQSGKFYQIIIHPGMRTYELKGIIGEYYILRYLDYRIVKSMDVKEVLDKRNIHLIGWREVSEAFLK